MSKDWKEKKKAQFYHTRQDQNFQIRKKKKKQQQLATILSNKTLLTAIPH